MRDESELIQGRNSAFSVPGSSVCRGPHACSDERASGGSVQQSKSLELTAVEHARVQLIRAQKPLPRNKNEKNTISSPRDTIKTRSAFIRPAIKARFIKCGQGDSKTRES